MDLPNSDALRYRFAILANRLAEMVLALRAALF
jgi:hypothetical protein